MKNINDDNYEDHLIFMLLYMKKLKSGIHELEALLDIIEILEEDE